MDIFPTMVQSLLVIYYCIPVVYSVYSLQNMHMYTFLIKVIYNKIQYKIHVSMCLLHL